MRDMHCFSDRKKDGVLGKETKEKLENEKFRFIKSEDVEHEKRNKLL